MACSTAQASSSSCSTDRGKLLATGERWGDVLWDGSLGVMILKDKSLFFFLGMGGSSLERRDGLEEKGVSLSLNESTGEDGADV